MAWRDRGSHFRGYWKKRKIFRQPNHFGASEHITCLAVGRIFLLALIEFGSACSTYFNCCSIIKAVICVAFDCSALRVPLPAALHCSGGIIILSLLCVRKDNFSNLHEPQPQRRRSKHKNTNQDMAQHNPHGTAGGPGLDSDLDDLLGNGGGGGNNNSPSKSVAQSAFASTSSSTYTYADRHKSYYTSNGGLGCCGYLSACCWLTFQSSPKCGWILTVLVLIGMAYGLLYLLDPTVEVGVVSHAWTNVKSVYDLKAGDISHWCLDGGDSSCRCEDPLVPADRGEFKSWSKAHAANKRLINRYTDPYSPDSGDVDVAFLGESLIEEMDGRWLGMTQVS